jgi:hypothetical protein
MSHKLEFSLDKELVEERQKQGKEADAADPYMWLISIKCHDARPHDERDCRMWIECGHTFGTECSASPSGRHALFNGVGRYWSDWCWAEVCDYGTDAAIELIRRHDLPFGSYSIDIDDTDESHISFVLVDKED